jgi:hypothetical protein
VGEVHSHDMMAVVKISDYLCDASFADLFKIVSRAVSWTNPMGMPVLQPYMHPTRIQVRVAWLHFGGLGFIIVLLLPLPSNPRSKP